jgi:hypothetical protein
MTFLTFSVIYVCYEFWQLIIQFDILLRMDSTLTADHIKQYLMQINKEQADPIIFRGMISNWKASRWQPDNLDAVFDNETLTFRVGRKQAVGR